jgi:hyperosmotically inducible protein
MVVALFALRHRARTRQRDPLGAAGSARKGRANMKRFLGRVLRILPALLFLGAATARAESDTLIIVKAKIALLTTDGVSAHDVKVDSTSGIVTIHGKVKSEGEKTKAEAVVKNVDGVKSVRNLLQVVPASIKEAVNASDSMLKENVSAALKSNAALKSAEIKVSSVDAGVVLLSGTAETLDQKLAAIETAYGVRGVVRVASEIKAPVGTE